MHFVGHVGNDLSTAVTCVDPTPLPQNSSSWVLNDLAAVYWRVMGNGEMAVRCLKVALQHAPAKYRVSVSVRVRGVRGGE